MQGCKANLRYVASKTLSDGSYLDALKHMVSQLQW